MLGVVEADELALVSGLVLGAGLGAVLPASGCVVPVGAVLVAD